MTMVPKLLKQFRRSLQIKKSIANARRVLLFPEQSKYTYQSITSCEKRLVSRTPPTQAKKAAEVSQKTAQ